MRHMPLAEALEVVRNELGTAQDAGQDEQLQFRVVEVEMEFVVEFRSEGGTDGKIALAVVAWGGSGKVSRGALHRMKVKLEVKDAATGGGPVDVRRDESRQWGG